MRCPGEGHDMHQTHGWQRSMRRRPPRPGRGRPRPAPSAAVSCGCSLMDASPSAAHSLGSSTDCCEADGSDSRRCANHPVCCPSCMWAAAHAAPRCSRQCAPSCMSMHCKVRSMTPGCRAAGFLTRRQRSSRVAAATHHGRQQCVRQLPRLAPNLRDGVPLRIAGIPFPGGQPCAVQQT